MKPQLRLSLWQGAPISNDVAASLGVIESYARQVRDLGADVLVFPEMMLTGYNIGSQQIAKLAESATGASAEHIARIAEMHSIAIAYGYPERDGDDIYNAALLIDADGTSLLNYRKTHLFGASEKTDFRAGERLDSVADLQGWTVGLQICYDVEFPEATRMLALSGVDLVLVPTANMAPYNSLPEVLVPARAYENQVYVAYANYCGSEGDLEFTGSSMIVAPNGEHLALADQDETLLVADITTGDLATARKLNTYLADRRPKLYVDLLRKGRGS